MLSFSLLNASSFNTSPSSPSPLGAGRYRLQTLNVQRFNGNFWLFSFVQRESQSNLHAVVLPFKGELEGVIFLCANEIPFKLECRCSPPSGESKQSEVPIYRNEGGTWFLTFITPFVSRFLPFVIKNAPFVKK
jgi:hypothetical protein